MNLRATVTMKGHAFDGKGPEIVRKEMVGAMTEAVMFLEKKVKEGTPVGVYGAQGGLLSQIAGFVFKGATVVKGMVLHASPYGDVVEKGRTPGKAMPPAGTLVRWIELKMGVDETTAAKIEFAVRRKIGRKGFAGAEMFEHAFENNWPHLESIFDRRGFVVAKELSA